MRTVVGQQVICLVWVTILRTPRSLIILTQIILTESEFDELFREAELQELHQC